MESRLVNRVPSPVVVDDDDDVIDLDEVEKTPLELIYEWDAKIKKKLAVFAVADNERVLEDLMKEYLESLQDISETCEGTENCEILKNKVYIHINFLYHYFQELRCCTPDSYLSSMEDILTLYCNLQLEVIRPLKKKDLSKFANNKRIASVTKHVIKVLTVFLLERHDHILHVLIKMNTSKSKILDGSSKLLNLLYAHFLNNVREFNNSDESFCRSYIVFQKWKHIRNKEDWEKMDTVMYKMFKREPDSIKKSEILTQILTPSCFHTFDIVASLYNAVRAISKAYFRHITVKKSIEMDDLDFNIDLGEDDPIVSLDDESDEEVQLTAAYKKVEENMLSLRCKDTPEMNILRSCKLEFDEDDDVQFVGITVLPKRPILAFVVDSEDSDSVSNMSTPMRVPTPPPPLPPKPKTPDLENLNGLTRILVGSPRTVPESPSCHSIEPPPSPVISPSKELVVQLEPDEPRPITTPSEEIAVEVQPTEPRPIIIPPKDLAVEVQPTEPTPIIIPPKDLAVEVKPNEPRPIITPPKDLAVDVKPSEPRPIITPPKDLAVEVKPNEPRPIITLPKDLAVEVEPNEPIIPEVVEIEEPSSETIPESTIVVSEPISTIVVSEPVATIVASEPVATIVASEAIAAACQTANIEVVVEPLVPVKEVTLGEPVLTVASVDAATETSQTEVTSEKSSFEVKKIVEKRSVEVQAGNNYVYNDYGLNTPPFDVVPDEQTRSEEPLYASLGEKLEEPKTKSIEVQVPSFELGLTPPNDSHSEDHSRVQQTCLYTNIVEKDSEIAQEPSEEHHDSEFDEIDIAVAHVDAESENDEIDVESCTEPPEQIDTGQVPTPPPAQPPETFNGNTILKPIQASNRTNGTTSKIMYTSSQKIRPLDDFSKFEDFIWDKTKENRDLDEILAGPVSKIITPKHGLLTAQDKLEIFGQEGKGGTSRSSSPNEMTSPAYEDIEDFRNYYSDSVNGRVPPPHDVKVPPGILKKSNTARRKNYRIMFHESTCDNSEERRPRSDGVLVPKRVRRDRKLNMEARVVVERLSFIDKEIKKVINSYHPTVRVDYDKTTNYINEKDVVRCISPPKFSWIVNISSNRHNPGKVALNDLTEEFTKLNCNVEEKALNLTIPDPDPDEFSNSPTFSPNTDEIVQHLEEAEENEEVAREKSELLCENSNFYPNVESSNLESKLESLIQLPTAVPESYDFDKNLKNEVFSKVESQPLYDSDGETRLPLKKRKLSVKDEIKVEETKKEEKKEEISYPATPMISIAEVEALNPRKLNNARPFKTPAERKEMPPLPVFYNIDSDPSPIITDQFNINNHTYNNPTINYHMNNVPVPFINIPCGSYYSLPPILVPFNNVSNFEQPNVNQQQEYAKKEAKKGRRRRN